MIETEIKIKINDYDQTLKKLQNLFEFCKNFKKNDTYYTLQNKFFRLRKDDNHHFVTAKEKIIVNNIEVNKEYEFCMEDIDNFLGFIWILGAKKSYSKTKIGSAFKKDKFLLELSEVLSDGKSLGYFLEIEYLSKEYTKQISDDLLEIAHSLGFKEDDITTKTYSEMIKKT